MTDDYFDELEEWRTLVGTAILGFGEIELVTLKCLEHLPNDNIYPSTSSLPLGKRIDIISDILEPRSTEPAIAVFVEKLHRAKVLSEFRNVIAHSPLVAEVFQHRETGNVEVQNLIRSARNKKKALDLSSMKEISAEIEELASELWMAIAEIAQIDD